MTANRTKSGTRQRARGLLFRLSKSLSELNQSAIDFLSETLLWFSVRGVSENLKPGSRQQDHLDNKLDNKDDEASNLDNSNPDPDIGISVVACLYAAGAGTEPTRRTGAAA